MGFHQRFKVHDLKLEGWVVTGFDGPDGGMTVFMEKDGKKCKVNYVGVKIDL